MSFDAITGQPFALELCQNWLQRDTTHPLLFYGPEGASKKALALELAKALNCKTGTRNGCDECLSCKKIAAGNHPDVRVIDLAWQAVMRKEPLEKQQALRIETMLAERHRLFQSPVEGHWKVSIIEEAHRMTPDAANVLLKVLEEPPANTAMILVTEFRDRLLPTILSRCQPVRFRQPEQTPPMSHEELEARGQAEALWESLSTAAPARLVQVAEGRARSTKLGRTEIEQQIERLLVPASQALRAGDLAAQEPVRLLQNALTQLRQNVQPGLVYDNLLLQLSKQRAVSSKPG